MKYIRVKNGVFAVNEEHGIKYIILAKDYLVKYFCDSRHIIAEADTIEELCDCLMFVDNDEQKDFLITEVNKDNLNYYDIKSETCYGCIKVELPNGAIRIEPVAKANDKGELELI